MRTIRLMVSASSLLTILGGALLLSAPQSASAASFGCPTGSVREAISDLRDICGSGGGSGVINCYGDGSWDWDSVSCNS
jgi:hypothetical protein